MGHISLGMKRMDSHLPLVEPIAVLDVFISGIAEAEELEDGMIRLICYSKRKNPHDCSLERVVVASIVMTKETLVRNILVCAKPAELCVAADIEMLPRGDETLN